MPYETCIQRKTRLARERKRRQRTKDKLAAMALSEMNPDLLGKRRKRRAQSLDDSTRARKRALNAERVRRFRANESPEKAAKRREAAKLRNRIYLKGLSQEQLQHRRKQNALRRSRGTEEDKKKRREIERLRMAARREIKRQEKVNNDEFPEHQPNDQDAMIDPSDIEKIICAAIPDPETEPWSAS